MCEDGGEIGGGAGVHAVLLSPHERGARVRVPTAISSGKRVEAYTGLEISRVLGAYRAFAFLFLASVCLVGVPVIGPGHHSRVDTKSVDT